MHLLQLDMCDVLMRIADWRLWPTAGVRHYYGQSFLPAEMDRNPVQLLPSGTVTQSTSTARLVILAGEFAAKSTLLLEAYEIAFVDCC